MGISPPFSVTGLSGKIRIQILPPFLVNLVTTLRAASICLEVIQLDSKLFKPKLLKSTLVVLVALPKFLNLCAFLYLVFLGTNIIFSNYLETCKILKLTVFLIDNLSGILFGITEDITLVYPYLNTNTAVGCMGPTSGIINIGSQGLQRNFTIHQF